MDKSTNEHYCVPEAKWSGEFDYNFDLPLDVDYMSREGSLICELVNTNAVKRLNGISFLGGIDYYLVPHSNGCPTNKRYTRYQHSLGVAAIALFVANRLDLSTADRKLAVAVAILHDVGHAPLSHTLEPIFEESFGLNHHRATEEIILGRVNIGKDVVSTLKRHGIDCEEIVSILNGSSNKMSWLLNGPINIDTIEGILRSLRYIKRYPVCPSPLRVAAASVDRTNHADKEVVDDFWRCKDVVYNLMVRSARIGVLADAICQNIARGSLANISLDDIYSTENEFLKKLPNLREFLARKPPCSISIEGLHYIQRSFFIDKEGNFFSREDERRYKSVRTPKLAGNFKIDAHNLPGPVGGLLDVE
ncbi:MAG: HD domain-containing protein [Alphaproteobacteria bacterium]|nr:HD domain-containing protein [Alphaproteobacteria bacterium]